MKNLINIIKSLSDENRLRIVLMLRLKSMCVCEISQILSIADSTLSAHLKQLRLAGVIEQQKDGRWIEYRLTDDHQVLTLINDIVDLIEDKSLINQDIKKAGEVSRVKCSH